MFLGIDNVDVVLSADDEDDPHSDIYYNAATIYPWAARTCYLMFTAQFRHFSPKRNPFIRPRGAGPVGGFRHARGATRRQPRRRAAGTRPSREPYFPTGLADEWDRWYAVMAPGIVRRGNYLYQYYYSSGRLHDSAVLRPEYDDSAKQLGGVGIVRQRLDGFVSADADHQGRLAADAAHHVPGQSPAAQHRHRRRWARPSSRLQDDDGQPIPGFSAGRLRGDRRQLHRPAGLLEGQARRLLAGRQARADCTSS